MTKFKGIKTRAVLLFVAGATLVLGYQNCGQSVSFEAIETSNLNKTFADEDAPDVQIPDVVLGSEIVPSPEQAAPEAPAPVPEVADQPAPPTYAEIDDELTEEENQDAEEADFDHHGKRIGFRCGLPATGDTHMGEEIALANRTFFAPQVFPQKLRSLSVSSIKAPALIARKVGSAKIGGSEFKLNLTAIGLIAELNELLKKPKQFVEANKNSVLLNPEATQQLGHLVHQIKQRGVGEVIVGAETLEVDSVKANAVVLRGLNASVKNIAAHYTCITAKDAEEISNVKSSLATRILGRRNQGEIKRISNLESRLISVVARARVGEISDVKGTLLVRHSHVDKIANMTGTLILLQAEVKSLENFEGTIIRMDRKSKIIEEINVRKTAPMSVSKAH